MVRDPLAEKVAKIAKLSLKLDQLKKKVVEVRVELAKAMNMTSAPSVKRRRKVTPAGRRRMSEAMKASWALRKEKSNGL